VAVECTVTSDGWMGYSGLEQHGFTHLRVNHELFFVDPLTGANTNKIESFWNRLRYNIVRGSRNISIENLPLYLAFEWWLTLYRNYKKNCYPAIQIMIEHFFTDIATVYAI
jgi:hypothetical protein